MFVPEFSMNNWIALNLKIVGITAARVRSDDHDQYHFLRFEDQPWPLREKISNSKSGLHNDGYFQWQMVRKMNAQFQKVSVPPVTCRVSEIKDDFFQV